MIRSPTEIIKDWELSSALLENEYERGALPNHTLIVQENREEQLLISLGVIHTSDPTSRIWEQIGDTWWFFNKLTEGRPRAIVGEGGDMEIESLNSHADAMSHGNGEQALLRLLARENGDEFVSPDTGFPEAQHIPETFSTEDIALYYFMRYGPQMYRGGIIEDEAVYLYLQTRLDKLRKAFCAPASSRYRGFDFSYENLTRIYEDRYHKPFTTLDVEFLTEETVGHLFHPERPQDPNESQVSLISREVNQLRRKNLLALYDRLWREGKSVYSLFGEPHIIKMAKEIRKIGEPLQTIYHTYVTPRDIEIGRVSLSEFRTFNN